jgi:hypothetical protein
MPRTASTPRWFFRKITPPCCPDDLLPEVQRTLAALADVEVSYEEAREAFEREPPSVRQPRLVEIKARYRRERQPYVERLEHLQERIRGWLMPGSEVRQHDRNAPDPGQLVLWTPAGVCSPRREPCRWTKIV